MRKDWVHLPDHFEYDPRTLDSVSRNGPPKKNSPLSLAIYLKKNHPFAKIPKGPVCSAMKFVEEMEEKSWVYVGDEFQYSTSDLKTAPKSFNVRMNGEIKRGVRAEDCIRCMRLHQYKVPAFFLVNTNSNKRTLQTNPNPVAWSPPVLRHKRFWKR